MALKVSLSRSLLSAALPSHSMRRMMLLEAKVNHRANEQMCDNSIDGHIRSGVRRVDKNAEGRRGH